jgi:hypothetical protein
MVVLSSKCVLPRNISDRPTTFTPLAGQNKCWGIAPYRRTYRKEGTAQAAISVISVHMSQKDPRRSKESKASLSATDLRTSRERFVHNSTHHG